MSLGLELPHLDAFFAEADLDGNGSLSLLEALQGFARMKERLKNDERALAFLRHLFEAHLNENASPRSLTDQKAARHETRSTLKTIQGLASPLEANPSPRPDEKTGLNREQFIQYFGQPKIIEKLNSYGIYGSMTDFWEFVAPKDGLMTVENLLAGYLKYRDPKYGGDKAVVFLRHLFEQCDTDGSGELSKREFMQILRTPKNMEKLHALGMNVGAENDKEKPKDDEVEDALLVFFYELDVDFSGSISVDEMISGFIRCRDECRMRQLESSGLAALENLEKARQPLSRQKTMSTPDTPNHAPTPGGRQLVKQVTGALNFTKGASENPGKTRSPGGESTDMKSAMKDFGKSTGKSKKSVQVSEK